MINLWLNIDIEVLMCLYNVQKSRNLLPKRLPRIRENQHVTIATHDDGVNYHSYIRFISLSIIFKSRTKILKPSHRLHEFSKETRISDEHVHIYVTLDYKEKQIEK